MIQVVAALIWQDDKFLICQRPQGKSQALLWEFAGGKVEGGESPQTALAREIREELAVDISVGDLYTVVNHTYPDKSISLSVYNAVITAGTPQLLEHNAMAWVTPEQAGKYQFCPADQPIVDKIICDIKKE